MSKRNNGMPIQPLSQVEFDPTQIDQGAQSHILPPGYEVRIAKPGHGLAIAGFVVALVGVIFGLIPLTFIMAWVCGAAGFVLSIFGRRYKLGKAGVILGLIAIALGIIGLIIVNGVFNSVGNSLDCISSASTSAQINEC